MKRPKKKSEGGISLIEVTFAVAIIRVGVSVLMSQLECSYKVTSVNRETNKAMAHLEAALEKVTNTPFSKITSDFPDGSGVYLGEIDSTDLLRSEYITVSYLDTDADPLQVSVTIQWTSFDGRQRTRSLATMVTR